MQYTVNLPVLGDTTRSAVITSWIVNVGESVEAGDPLVNVESDKAAVEVPSPVAGVVLSHLVAEEDEIEIGVPIAVIETRD
jgi:pyruvate/2-oxoglutarate dehydrogenase complex dihydrolipoamide acyltransferase (E2) component